MRWLSTYLDQITGLYCLKHRSDSWHQWYQISKTVRWSYEHHDCYSRSTQVLLVAQILVHGQEYHEIVSYH